MDPDTFRSDIGVDVYWRRRMTALIGVLVVVAVVAWACSATGPDGESKVDAQAGTSPTPDPILALLPTMTATPVPAVAPQAAPQAAPAGQTAPPAVSPAPKPVARPKRPGDACDPADLVLNMQGLGEVYAGDNRPRLVLTLVNVGKVMCTTDVGPRTLEVRITSGTDRVWSSADCISGETDDLRKLERGIPYVREVQWDRRRSGGDCAAKRAAARAGTYVATVHSPRLKSHKAVFHLR